MGEKEKILSKFNIKDYRNDLELVLDNKQFDEEAKSLILNIFYKMDNFYKDYSSVKLDCAQKNQFLENYINIVKRKCRKINLLSASKISANQKIIIDKLKGKIECFPNELNLLYAIYELDEKNIMYDKFLLEDYTNECVNNVLMKGKTINSTEPIRDFTGWSWNIQFDNPDNIVYNLIFQNVLLLFGYEGFSECLKKNNIIESLNKKINEMNYDKQGYNFLMDLFEICVILYNNQSKENQEKCFKFKKSLINKKNMLNTRKEYVEDKTKDSSDISKQIKKIDEILNDIKLIRKEYLNANEDNDNQFLCISEFVEFKEKEKKSLLNKIKENNKVLIKKQYLFNHDDYEETLKLYNLVDEEKAKIGVQSKIVKLEIDFLQCMNLKIANAELKKDLYTIATELRYFSNLLNRKDASVVENERIAKVFDEVCRNLINKMIENKVIDIGFKSQKLNYDILKYIFKTKMIELQNMSIKISFIKDNQIEVQYYDDKIMEYKQNFDIPLEEEITNKKDKKNKVFKIGG